MTRSLTKFFLLPIIALTVLGACSSDDPVDMQHTHYFTPVWTPNSSIVAFGVEDAVRPGLPTSSISTPYMEFVEVSTSERRRVLLPNVNTRHARYQFEISNKVLAVLSGGLHFFDLDGTPLWRYDRNDGGYVPADFALLKSGNGFIWGGSRDGRTHVAITRYDRNSWSEIGEEVLKDTAMAATFVAVALTSHRSYVMRMSDGSVLEFDFSGELLGSWSTVHFETDNVNHYRMDYLAPASGKRWLYLLEQSALLRIDLDEQSLEHLIRGGITDFSLHPGVNFMVYETKSVDTWFGLATGYPLVRILPHNAMPRFSPDGKYLAAVGLVSPQVDTLTIIRPEISS